MCPWPSASSRWFSRSLCFWMLLFVPWSLFSEGSWQTFSQTKVTKSLRKWSCQFCDSLLFYWSLTCFSAFFRALYARWAYKKLLHTSPSDSNTSLGCLWHTFLAFSWDRVCLGYRGVFQLGFYCKLLPTYLSFCAQIGKILQMRLSRESRARESNWFGNMSKKTMRVNQIRLK